mmetsp:Transcript_6278/g.15282  ORF Transcript_6278/g.15282 Transcript_6278/m.15282 type:complete len:214 (-) Transcript_6278:394-1035(-)
MPALLIFTITTIHPGARPSSTSHLPARHHAPPPPVPPPPPCPRLLRPRRIRRRPRNQARLLLLLLQAQVLRLLPPLTVHPIRLGLRPAGCLRHRPRRPVRLPVDAQARVGVADAQGQRRGPRQVRRHRPLRARRHRGEPPLPRLHLPALRAAGGQRLRPQGREQRHRRPLRAGVRRRRRGGVRGGDGREDVAEGSRGHAAARRHGEGRAGRPE